MDDKNTDKSSLNTLEEPGTTVASPGEADSTSLEYNANTPKEVPKVATVHKSRRLRIQNLITHINIYLLLFILIVIVSVVIVFVSIQKSKKDAVVPVITTQNLSQDALDKVKGSDAKVGDPKQTLSIEYNAIFSGKVLIRDSLDVAGGIKVGGPLSLPGITVSGNSTFDQITANNLSIAGNTSIQGQLTVQKTLTVTGGASFGGPISAPQLSIQSLQLNSDLQLNRHIDAGGGTPGKTDGGAAGSGGTTSVSGSDTAGTVTINTGSGTFAGCFVTVNFAQKFNATPHVVISPVGPSAASLNYYVTRTTTSFSICTTNAAPTGSSFSFDYVVID
jgi:cytoskeletal protein CcmA (bactofilin family)